MSSTEKPSPGAGDAEKRPKEDKDICKWILSGISNITVEPMMFLHAASMMMMFIIAQSLKIYKICRGIFEYDIETCKNLTANKELEAEVQKVASDYGMYWVIIQTVPSLIFIMFLGSWSDRHGRKLPMILPLTGSILASIVYVLSAQYESLPPLFLLLGPAFAGLSGGMMTMIMAVFSYITDISSPENRTVRIGFAYGVWFLGSPAGSVAGGFLMQNYGYTTVFIVGTVVLAFCDLYVIFRLEEAPLPKLDESAAPSKGIFKDLVDCRNVLDSFKTCLKPRPKNRRLHLWILILALCGLFIPITGEGNVRYLYTRLKFNWSEAMFSYYTAAILAVGAFGVMVVMPFLKNMVGVSDFTIAIIAITGKIIAEAITAFSVTWWMMFCAVIPILYECSGPPIRSLMTQCVQPNEVGKAFAVLAIIESAIPIASGVMYSQVYNLTINVFPGTVFMLSSGVFVVVIISLLWLIHDTRKQDAISEDIKPDIEKNSLGEMKIPSGLKQYQNNAFVSDDFTQNQSIPVQTSDCVSKL